jgi:hypothetical protein
MTDRNWDAEMAKIDRRLGSVSDEELARKSLAPAAPVPATGAPPGLRSGKLDWGVAIRVSLAVALGVAVLFWPYESLCGAGLAAYLGAVVAIVAAGTWGALASWRARAPRAHLVSLAVILWGVSLGAREVLPRAGYAKEARAWACK